MTYQEADRILQNTCGKGKNLRRKLTHNTWLERHDDHIAVRLHHTDIIQFWPDGRITLHTGGWQTPTTKARLNDYARCHVYGHNGVWYHSPSNRRFVSGMEADGNGGAAGYRTWDAIMALARDCRGWPGVVEECTLEGTWRATYERLCDDLDVVRQVPKGRRADYPLDVLMTRFTPAMCTMRDAARRAA